MSHAALTPALPPRGRVAVDLFKERMGLMRQARWLVVLFCVLVGALGVCAPAFAARDHIFSGSFGEAGSGNGQFEGPDGLAVNEASGDVYVIGQGGEHGRVEYFDTNGAYLGQFDGSGSNIAVEGEAAPTGQFRFPGAIAVDNDPSSPSYGDVYIADTGHRVVDKFSSSGAYLGQLTETSGGTSVGEVTGLAVDANGTLWAYQDNKVVDEFTGAVTNQFVSARELATTGSVFTADSLDDLYAETLETGIGKFDAVGEIEVEDFDSLLTEPQRVRFRAIVADLANNDVYIGDADGAGSVGRFSAAGTLLETFGSNQLSAEGTSAVAVDDATSEVFVADRAANAVYAFTLEPEAAPTIEEESALEVTDGSAELATKLKPTGPPASYYFQYGTQSCSAAPSACVDLPAAPGAAIGGGFESTAASARLQGLSPETTYHYRVIAENALGKSEGAERTFTTQTASTGFSLPDGREWEMVTPPNKYGAGLISLGSEQGAVIQAAAEGGAIAYAATSPLAPSPEGNRSPEVTQAISRRNASGDWETQDITTPHSEGATELRAGMETEYKLFSENLELGLLEPVGDTPLPPQPAGAERTLYLRKANGQFEALVEADNTLAGAKYGGIEFDAASPDVSHVVLYSPTKLTAVPGDEGGVLYEWAAGKLQPISVLPNKEIVKATVGSGHEGERARRAVSNNGSLVFYYQTGPHEGHLYLRDVGRGETAQIDAAQGVAEPTVPLSSFVTANTEDTRVFFTSQGRLTPDSTALESGEDQDLYVYEVTSGQSAPLAGTLNDLTVDANAGESANVRGVIGASEDGSYVYFVADGMLGDGAAEGAVTGNCGSERLPTHCNLYEDHYDAAAKAWGAPSYIATLSGEDQPDWVEESPHGNPSGLTSRVSPNGSYLTFMSSRSLTGYDNRDANSSASDEEVYLYDAASGRLVCASCDPTGARPVGIHEGSAYEEHLVDYALNWQRRWLAANVPGLTNKDLKISLYQSRFLANDARLFFDSSDALVPADVDGTEDVYEYEPVGVGGCEVSTQSASMVYGAASEGCVALISSGISAEESAFLDASEGGGEVFFLTAAKLSAADYDNSYDIYDAHECTTSSSCAAPATVPAPPCDTGDSCKPAPSSQPAIFGAPPSATFSGAGNLKAPSSTKHVTAPRKLTKARRLAKALKACARKPKRRRRRCRANAQRRYGDEPGHGKSAQGGEGR